MPSAIPIQNIYYLFCYAWNRLEEGNVVDVGAVDSPELVDLLAKVLIGGIEHLIRRGIDRQYVEQEEVLPVVRGRIGISESMMLALRRAPRVHCVFDELSIDIVPNQILKATLVRLAGASNIHPDNAHRLRSVAKQFRGVSDIRLRSHHFQQVLIRRHNAFYGFLMNVCELVYDLMLPTEGGQGSRFADILRDERKMALVFQAFVRNFLKLEQSKYAVSAIQLEWDVSGDPGAIRLLPTMNTDIFLSSAVDKIIVDTKYYRDAMQERFENRTIHSGNLYQLFSYVKNAEKRGVEFAHARGVLLYPMVGECLDVVVVAQGHELRAVTINLNQEWNNVRRDLLRIFQ